MKKRSIDELERQFRKEMEKKTKGDPEMPTVITCEICEKGKPNCKPVEVEHLRTVMICGKCRYDFAMGRKRDENSASREFIVTLVLNKLAREDLVTLGVIFMAAKIMPMAKFFEAREKPTKDYKEMRDRIWKVLRDHNLLHKGAERYDP